MVKIDGKFKKKGFFKRKDYNKPFEKLKKAYEEKVEWESRFLLLLREIRRREAVSRSLGLFFKRFIYKGLGLSAFRIAKQFCYLIKQRYRCGPLKIFHKFLRHTLPLVQLRAIRKSGMTHLIPFLFRSDTRPITISINWFLKSVKERRSIKRIPFIERLAAQSFNELQDVLSLKGSTIAKRQSWHKLASRNSAIRYLARHSRRYSWKGQNRTIFDNPLSSSEFVYQHEAKDFIFSGFWYTLYSKRLSFLRERLQRRYYQLRSFFLFGRLQARRSYYTYLRLVFLSFQYITFRIIKQQFYRFVYLVSSGTFAWSRKNTGVFLRFLLILYFGSLKRLNGQIGDLSRKIRLKICIFRRILRNVSTRLLAKFKQLISWQYSISMEPKGLPTVYSARRNQAVTQHLIRQNANNDGLSNVYFKRSFRETKDFFKTFGKILFDRSKNVLFLYRTGSHFFNLLNFRFQRNLANLYGFDLGRKSWSIENFEYFLAVNKINSQKIFEIMQPFKCIWSKKFIFFKRKRGSLLNSNKFFSYFFPFFRYSGLNYAIDFSKDLDFRYLKNKFVKLRRSYQKFINERHLPRDFKRILRFKHVQANLYKALNPVELLPHFNSYINFWLPSFCLYFHRFSEYFNLVNDSLEPKPTFKVLVFFSTKKRKYIRMQSFEDFYQSPTLYSLLELIPDWRLRKHFVEFFSQSYFKPLHTLVRYIVLEYWNKRIALHRYFSTRQFKSGLFFSKFNRVSWLAKRKKWRKRNLRNKSYKKVKAANFRINKLSKKKMISGIPKLPFTDLMFFNFQYWEGIRPRLIPFIQPRFSWFHKLSFARYLSGRRGLVSTRPCLRKVRNSRRVRAKFFDLKNLRHDNNKFF